MSTDFGQALLRLKEQLAMQTDKEVAAALGMAEKAFNARKRRGVFPQDKLWALATKQPELNLDVTYVLTGKTQKETLAEKAAAVSSGFGKRIDIEALKATTLAERNFRQDRLLEYWARCSMDDQNAIEVIVKGLAEKAANSRGK